MQIDIVSDVVCPWCFVGKRRLGEALAQWRSERPGEPVTVRWLPYFLNPDTPVEGEPYRPFLERKFGGPEALEAIWARVREAGASAGIAFAFERIEKRANTLAAHRLIHRFQAEAVGDTQALVEALFAAQFLEGRHVGDPSVLAGIAAACGDDEAAAMTFLASDRYAREVTTVAERVQAMGVSGVPFFIFDGKLAVSGAQPPAVLLGAMAQAASS